MTDKPEIIETEWVETAPLIYFDTAPAFGTLAGAIQVELFARIMTPLGGADVKNSLLPTGQLRCSPAAALSLRNALDQALQMHESTQGSSPDKSKMN